LAYIKVILRKVTYLVQIMTKPILILLFTNILSFKYFREKVKNIKSKE